MSEVIGGLNINNNDIGELIMHGGAKRTEELKMGWFESIMHMLKHAEEIECISYSSLKGFVFRVTLSYDLQVGDFMYKVGTQETKTKAKAKDIYTVTRIEKKDDGVVYVIKGPRENNKTETETEIQYIKKEKDRYYNNEKNEFKSVNPFQSITAGSKSTIAKTLKKILIKFTLLTSDDTTINLQKYNGRIKQTDKLLDFKKEVTNQIDIFKKTYINRGLSICPSILYDRACDDTESTVFLDIFNTLPGLTQRGKNVTKYLQRMISLYNSTYNIKINLGMIFMEYADSESQTGNNPGFILFEKLYYNAITKEKNINENIDKYDDEIKQIKNYISSGSTFPDSSNKNIIILHRIALILSNMIVLLYQTGFVHCDLHQQNIFVKDFFVNEYRDECQLLYVLSQVSSCTRMIDFGRIINVEDLNGGENEEKWNKIDKKIDNKLGSDNNNKLFTYLSQIDTIQNNIFNYKIIKTKSNSIKTEYNTELFAKKIVLIKDENTQKRSKSAQEIELKEILLSILKVLRFIFETDLTYNTKYNSNKPQCMYLFEKSGLDIFFKIDLSTTPKVTINSEIFDNEKNIHPQIYVLLLVAKYMVYYFKMNKKPPNLNTEDIYKGSQEEKNTETDSYNNFKQSFQGQLLRYRLEQLKIQLDLKDETQKIEPIIIESFQLDDEKRFDLFDNQNGSIRTKEPGLELFFQSIDDIIGMKK